MALTTMTTKGQVTIPKAIRDTLRIKSGDRLEIVIIGDEAVIRPVSKSIADVFGMLEGKKNTSVSLEDMDNSIKNRMKNKFS